MSKHVSNSFMIHTVCSLNPKLNNLISERNFNSEDDLLEAFCKHLRSEKSRIASILKVVVPMNLSVDEERVYKKATVCHICEKTIPKWSEDNPKSMWKVRDHCHITGKYRGPAHSGCNINFKFRPFIPVIAHNSKGYDSHLFIKKLA